MTRYNIERLFGRLSPPPEDVYTRGADEVMAEVRARISGPDPREEDILEAFSLALRFTRPDGLTGDLGDTPLMGECLLQRGRLRFYLILSDKPDNPDHNLLEAVMNDYTMAAISPAAAAEAMAGLIRLRTILGDHSAAREDLQRLTRERSEDCRRAAAGALLFLAEQPGTPEAERRRLLRRAYRLFSKPPGEYADLIRSEIMMRLGQPESARFMLSERAAAGSLDAEIALLKMEVNLAEFRYNPSLLRPLWDRIKAYRTKRPADPQAYIAQGDIFFDYDPDAARASCMQALTADKRCSEAWFRLGELDRMEYEKSSSAEALENAVESYRSAVTLDVFSLNSRIELGRLELETGRPDLGITTLKAALALTNESITARRRLARCWTDLCASELLDPETRRTAAVQAKAEWEITVREDPLTIDYYGLIRSSLDAEADDVNYSQLISKLVVSRPPMRAKELIILAGMFILQMRFTEAARLLDAAESGEGGDPSLLLAHRAAILSASDREGGAELYIQAAAGEGVERNEYVEWTSAAAALYSESAKIEDLLKKALERYPGERTLLHSLSRFMVEWNRRDEAAELYSEALKQCPDNRDILEDAVWFFREEDRTELAENCIREALNRAPEDARLWNQLGVHFMESGWDAAHEELDAEALKRAVEAYRRAVEIEPEVPAYWANLGDVLRHSGEWSEASKALEKAGEMPFALNSMARLEDERSYAEAGTEASPGHWESAGTHYKAAAEAAGGNPEYDRDYAWWLYRECRPGEAVNYYSRAAALLPDDEELAYGEYRCRRDIGEESQALEALERALKSKPEDPLMLADKADLLGTMGKEDEALKIFEDLLDRGEEAPRLWTRLAEFRERLLFPDSGAFTVPRFHINAPPSIDEAFLTGSSRGDSRSSSPRDALAAWEKAASLQPEDKAVRGRFGLALMYNGRIEESRKVLETSLAPGGAWEDASVLRALARIDIASSDSDEAREAAAAGAARRLEQALEIVPNAGLYWSDLGLCRAFEGSWTKCFEACSSASDREPENAVILGNTGIAALCSDNAESAVDFLQRALAIDPSDAEWGNALGLAHLAAGQHNQAVEAFRAACLNDPQNQEYTANLAMACKSFNIPSEMIQ